MQGNWFVETQPCGEFPIVAIDGCWTPIVGERRVQSFSALKVDTPKSLARHPVQEVVARTWSCAGWCCEFAGIVRSTELIKSRIAFTALNVIESSYGRRFLPWSESDLGYAHRHPAQTVGRIRSGYEHRDHDPRPRPSISRRGG